ncbi:MAG: hypothetical protein IJC64_01935 [Clostridia bacterium]|nr:hypothetical protein [Clostridia bacterium]
MPEKNIDSIVSSVNEGIDVDEIVKGEEDLEMQDAIEQIKAELAKLLLEIKFSTTVDKDPATGYIGIKDRVIYSEVAGSKSYTFIEDDFKLVTVTDDGFGSGLYGSVDDSIYYYIQSMSVGEEENDKTQEFLDSIYDMRLPEISVEDMTYRDGKYYVSAEYIDKALTELADELMGEYKNAFPDSVTDDMIAQTKEALSEYVDKLGLEFWFNAEYETITGLGFSFVADSEFSQELGCETLSAMINVNGGKTEIDIYATADGKTAALNVVCEVTVDAEGKPVQLNAKIDAQLPYSTYDYSEELGQIMLEGDSKLSVDCKVDLSKINAGGDIVSVELSYNVDDFKAYTMDIETWEPTYNEDITAEYADHTVVLTTNATVTSVNAGEKITGCIEATTNMSVSEGTSTISLEFEAVASADNMPTISDEVYEARDAAIEEYNNPSDEWIPDWDDSEWDDSEWDDSEW